MEKPLREEAVREEKKRFEAFFAWLEKSMPQTFFDAVDQEWIPVIVHSLMSFKVQDFFSEIHLKNVAITLCVDSPDADCKILQSYPLFGIKNYSTYVSKEKIPIEGVDAHLRIATIIFTEAIEKVEKPLKPTQIKELVSYLRARQPKWSEEKCLSLIHHINPRFLRKMPKERQVVALEMYESSQTRDHCQYEAIYIEDWEKSNSPSMYLVLAWKNVPKHNFLYRLARVVNQHGLVMRGVNAAYTNPYSVESIFLLSVALHGAAGLAAWERADVPDFLQEVVTLKYFGSQDDIQKTFVETGLLRGNLANLLRTMTNFIHQVLVQLDPHEYSLDNIKEGLIRHPTLTVKLCEAFEQKFHPKHSDIKKYSQTREELVDLVDQLDTGHEFHDRRRKNILRQGINFVEHTLKTNFYGKNKTSHAFRLDPAYLDHAPFDRKALFPQLPYGIFFVKGMHFMGFHIRFKDLSRGGLRTIYPEKKERMLAERNTVFSECYNLAYTQHKKNKDIPEGGAKGVIFLKPYERLASEMQILAQEMRDAGLTEEEAALRTEEYKEEQKIEYLYQTQRSFVKNFLSLINYDEQGNLRAEDIVDYYKRPEYIYLGPDENMHDSMIQWIATASCNETYKPMGCFISGKPEIGINHKQFGVTSLGVDVYMHAMLSYLGIDPHIEPFTVKMTGGPDGDVAGNQILNLYKRCPQTAKLLALTDISGTIFDPQGLDLKVLVDLFHKGQPIHLYPPDRLSHGGFLLDRTQRREPSPYVQQTLCWRNENGGSVAHWLSGNEMNALFRNNVHQVEAEIFIPCGGRPRTLRDSNYRDFLGPTKEPTSRAIIEGANLYLTPWARTELENLGTLIIKDSSANKAGVICSSFEILCGLVLSDEEFLQQKSQIIEEIMVRLRLVAQDEAELLLQSHKELEKPLTEISDAISKKINLFTDQLLDYLEKIELSDNIKDPLIQCFLNYCLPSLRKHYSQRLISSIPDNHKKAIIASHISARLVYTKGLKWFPSLIEVLPLILHDKELFLR